MRLINHKQLQERGRGERERGREGGRKREEERGGEGEREGEREGGFLLLSCVVLQNTQ